MKRISVIIPGYNTAFELWSRCLRSVLAALGADDQVICVDDASPCADGFDRLRGETSDSRVSFVKLDVNGGAAGARNAGLEIATGEYITFVDSDDYVLPGIYERCLLQAKKDDGDIAVFGVRVIWSKDGLLKNDVIETTNFGAISPQDAKRLFDACLLEYPVNKLYRADFLKAHKIRFNAGICPGEDTAFNLECLIASPRVSVIGEIGYIYFRYDGSSLSRAYADLRRTLEYRTQLWRRYKEVVPGAREVFGNFGEYDEEAIIRAEWVNLWRRQSPASLLDRWIFLSQHRTVASNGRVVEFCYRLVYSFLRLHFYIRPIRRWQVKRLFPTVKEWKAGVV